MSRGEGTGDDRAGDAGPDRPGGTGDGRAGSTGHDRAGDAGRDPAGSTRNGPTGNTDHSPTGSTGQGRVGRVVRALGGSGLRGAVGRARAALLPSRSAAEMRKLTAGLGKAVWGRFDAPVGVRELGTALCAEMSARRGGRPVKLRFERFPDGIGVTGLWMEFPDFDLVIVEERAETVQQLVILGHELWHMHAGHCHHHLPGADAAALTLSAEGGGPGERESALPPLAPELSAALGQGGTPIAARNGSHESDEQEAEDFGHRLATAFRPWVDTGQGTPADPADPVGQAIQASLGYRRHRR